MSCAAVGAIEARLRQTTLSAFFADLQIDATEAISDALPWPAAVS
jgi:hypothetical protein